MIGGKPQRIVCNLIQKTKPLIENNADIMSGVVRKSSFLLHSLSLYVPSLVDLILKFFIIRLIVARLGAELLGTWGIFQTVLLLPMFVQQSLSFALFLQVSRRRHQNNLFYSGFFITVLFSIVFGLLIIFLTPLLISLFGIPPGYHAIALKGFRLTAVILVLMSVSQVFLSLLQAYNRFQLAGIMLLSVSLLNSSMDILLLRAGYGILALLTIDVVSNFLLCIAGVIACSVLIFRKLLSPVRSNAIRELLQEVKTQLVIRTAATIIWDLDPLIIPRFFGVHSMALYWIARRIPYILKNLIWTGTTPTVPAVTGDSSHDELKLQQIFWLQIFLILPVAVFLWIFSGNILSIWIGTGYETAASMMRTLILAVTLDVLPASFFYFFMAKAKNAYTTGIPFLAAAAKVLLSTVACLANDLQMLMFATVAGAGVFIGAMSWAIRKETELSLISLMKPLTGLTIGCAVAFLVCYFLSSPTSLFELLAYALFFGGIAYGLSLIIFRQFYPNIFAAILSNLSGLIYKRTSLQGAD